MISILLSRVCILVCGTLYPGYLSYKAVRAKIVEDHVKWIMYWIVFALFTTSEIFTDIFFTWLPFYYEFKVALIIWLLPPAGNGSSFLYKQYIHPLLQRHEKTVDYHLHQFREKWQDLLLIYVVNGSLCVCKSIMNVINKNFPNGIMGLLANNICDNATSVQASINIVEENEDRNHVPKKSNERKTSTKLNKNAVA